MATIPMSHGLLLAALLFALGLACLLLRRNLLFILMAIEIMFNAAGLAFVVVGAQWGTADGQAMFIFVLSVAAAEVPVALALLLLMQRRWKTIDANAIGTMRG
jgi:NADH-quinone oxidoreductase subunit K